MTSVTSDFHALWLESSDIMKLALKLHEKYIKILNLLSWLFFKFHDCFQAFQCLCQHQKLISLCMMRAESPSGESCTGALAGGGGAEWASMNSSVAVSIVWALNTLSENISRQPSESSCLRASPRGANTWRWKNDETCSREYPLQGQCSQVFPESHLTHVLKV